MLMAPFTSRFQRVWQCVHCNSPWIVRGMRAPVATRPTRAGWPLRRSAMPWTTDLLGLWHLAQRQEVLCSVLFSPGTFYAVSLCERCATGARVNLPTSFAMLIR